MTVPPRSLEVSGPAGRLRVLEAGSGAPAVVLVHGLGGTSMWWEMAMGHLADRHHVVAYDLRGHGGSEAPFDDRYDLAAHAADLEAVLDRLGLARVVLVGHSFGATIVLAALATLAKGRVAGVVLVDAAGDFSGAPPGVIEQFIGALQSEAYPDLVADAFTDNLERASETTRSCVLAGVETTLPAAMQGCYAALLRWQPGPALMAWQGPLLLIADAQNQSDFSLHAQHPDQPQQLVADTSHWIHLDQPAAFHAALDDFLAALDRRDS